ncbi:hypothetical protein L6Q21_09525 [Sandaracinobacter sp. RS1-74]|nr:hypothetical protein [Sandaracinobacteroides sayramensis]MCG2841218.1 hypothetical protein [Sandaracinobacteroides sayramensis]
MIPRCVASGLAIYAVVGLLGWGVVKLAACDRPAARYALDDRGSGTW